jgi:hypothetical protein
MHIEPLSETVTYNAAGNPVYLVPCLCGPREPSAGLWWLVSTHVLPRIRVLCDYGYFAAQLGTAAAGRMAKIGFGE